jgi:hypothetical protein
MFFATFADSLAHFAVKAFDRKGRKGIRKVRKNTNTLFPQISVQFDSHHGYLERGIHEQVRGNYFQAR